MRDAKKQARECCFLFSFLINFLTLQKPLNTLYCVGLIKGFHVLSIGFRCEWESIFCHVCQCLALNKSNLFQLRSLLSECT